MGFLTSLSSRLHTFRCNNFAFFATLYSSVLGEHRCLPIPKNDKFWVFAPLLPGTQAAPTILQCCHGLLVVCLVLGDSFETCFLSNYTFKKMGGSVPPQTKQNRPSCTAFAGTVQKGPSALEVAAHPVERVVRGTGDVQWRGLVVRCWWKPGLAPSDISYMKTYIKNLWKHFFV